SRPRPSPRRSVRATRCWWWPRCPGADARCKMPTLDRRKLQAIRGDSLMTRKPLLAAFAAFAFAATGASAQTEIQWWHSMGGALGDKVNDLANKFNASQKDYMVVPSFKGTYPESMTAASAAYRAGNAPHILQVFEVGMATMMSAKGAIVPVYKLMKDADEPFDPKAYLGPVAGYYTDSRGNMLSFPFNSSTAIFY